MLTGKRPLGRPRLRWEGDNRIDLGGIGVKTRNCADSIQTEIIGEPL